MTDPSVAELIEGVRGGSARAVARACRLIDERDPRATELLKGVFSYVQSAYVVGVTGTPGSGKSTIVDGLIGLYRKRGDRVGVLAIDPTSPYSGGAILGDRIRMQRHFLDEHVFIRSIATRGHLGGLSRSTGDVLHVLRAARFDVVILETVGVGQDELEVTRLADTTLVVVAPGLGDDVQAIKAGILEIADVFVVNKADRQGAEAAFQDLQQMLSLRSLPGGGKAPTGHSAAASLRAVPAAGDGEWVPPIVRTVAVRAEGLPELVDAMGSHRDFLNGTEAGNQARARRRAAEFRAILHDGLIDALDAHFSGEVDRATEEVVARSVDPYTAAESLVRRAIATADDS